MKKHLALLVLLVNTTLLFAQVPKTVVVEHFTNSRCSICANQNPGFYANLAQHPDILHIAYHPSSPYPMCLFSVLNPQENDGRANFYDVFGSTPQFVIQGTPITPSGSYSSPTLFAPFTGQTSPVSMRATIQQTADSIISIIHIKTEAMVTTDPIQLFAALSEDTALYASPNGETMHFDVHRKSFFGNSGTAVTLPSTVGDSIVLRAAVFILPEWNLPRLKTIAILQYTEGHAVVQSAQSEKNSGIPASLKSASTMEQFQLYPNPASTSVSITTSQHSPCQYVISDISGRKIASGNFQQQTAIDVSDFQNGMYVISVGQLGFMRLIIAR